MAKGDGSKRSGAVQAAGRESGLVQPTGREIQPAGRITLTEALREYIQTKGLSCNAQADDLTQRREQLRLARDAGTAAKIMQGFWLAEIKEVDGQDAFIAAAADLRIGRSAAYNALDTLAIFLRLPDLDAVAALGQLDPSKALIYKGLPDAELVAFARGEAVHGITLEQAIEETVTALERRERDWRLEQDELQRLRKANAELENDRDVLQAKLKIATNDNPAAKLTKADLFRRRKKLAAHGLAELAQRTALEAARLVGELCEDQWLPQNADDALADKALCTSVVLEVAAAKAAWDELHASLAKTLKGRISARLDDIPVMSKSEIEDARKRRAAMAEFTKAELDNITALNYARDALDDATDRGATPKAFRKLRKA